MLKNKILERLQEMRQLHLAEHLDSLSDEQQQHLLEQLSPALLKSQQDRLLHPASLPHLPELVFEAEPASQQWVPLGIESLSQGKVACLILAGGQGSRLGSSLPKALVPVTPSGDKTLLELQLQKIAAASHFHRTKIPCAILTSPENHAAIAQFLEDHHFFDLHPTEVTLVTQKEAPFLDEQGNWILREDGRLASGPDGNGYALHLLKEHGILEKWGKKQIETLTITPIDNALADPVDPILIGYHVAHKADVTLKVVRKQSAEEKVGVIVRQDHHIAVREYSEICAQQNLPLGLAHIGLFALCVSFAQQVSEQEFPWHLAHKQDRVTGQWIWKYERFIFDMLPYAQKTNLLLYPREDVYAPLKNATGEKSLATVQAALKKHFENGKIA